jgi:FixJ family two-component response regulator
MPHMTGLELAERLRATDVGVPILLLMGSVSPAMVARATELGIERLLEKPLSEKDLFDFIDANRH